MPRRRRDEFEVTEVVPLVRQLKEVSVSQYFTREFMFYLTPLYCSVQARNVETGEIKTFIIKRNFILYAEIEGDRLRVQLRPFSSDFLADKGIYVKRAPSILEPRIPSRVLEAIISGNLEVPRPADVYSMVRKCFEKYIDFPDSRCYVFFPLWVIGTYFYQMFHSYPYLYITGMKHSGKTKNLELFARLCYNAMFSTDISPASLYRTVEDTGCTLLIDEAEKIRSDMRGMLLSGYKKGGKVYRVEETREGKVAVAFNVYCPKAIANIEGIEDVLEDRCISFTMIRGKKKEVVLREIRDDDPDIVRAREMLYFLAITRWYELWDVYANIVPPFEMEGRVWELWKSVFALAVWISSDIMGVSRLSLATRLPQYLDYPIIKEIVSLCREKIKAKQTTDILENLDYMVVCALVDIVNTELRDRDDWYAVSEVRRRVIELFIEDEREARKLDSKKVRQILRRHFGFRIRKTGNRYYVYIERSRVEDIASRLGIPIRQPAEIGEIEIEREEESRQEEQVYEVVVSSVERLEEPTQGICEMCGRETTLVAKVNGVYVCEECLREVESSAGMVAQESDKSSTSNK